MRAVHYYGGIQLHIVIPIINPISDNITLPIFFNNEIAINTITKEDYYFCNVFIESNHQEFEKLLQTSSKCITISLNSTNNLEQVMNESSSMLLFILNYFKKSEPLYLFMSLFISDDGASLQNTLFDLPANYQSYLQKEFDFKEGINTSVLIETYTMLEKAYKNNPAILFTCNKFNEFHYKTKLNEKIVDLTITFESMIPGTTELRYRFCVTQAILSEPKIGSRKLAFGLFDKLYNSRSGIVHGDIDTNSRKKDIDFVTSSLDQIYQYLRSSLFYFLAFTSENSKKSWEQHLTQLVIGTETRKY